MWLNARCFISDLQLKTLMAHTVNTELQISQQIVLCFVFFINGTERW